MLSWSKYDEIDNNNWVVADFVQAEFFDGKIIVILEGGAKVMRRIL